MQSVAELTSSPAPNLNATDSDERDPICQCGTSTTRYEPDMYLVSDHTIPGSPAKGTTDQGPDHGSRLKMAEELLAGGRLLLTLGTWHCNHGELHTWKQGR
jgi:hypothetical protein